MKRPKKLPRDAAQRAKAIIDLATADEPPPQPPITPAPSSDKNPHAQALGKLGGLKGGKARAAKLTPEQRSEIARRAAQARWRNQGRRNLGTDGPTT